MLSDEERKAIVNLKTEYEKLIKEDNILFPLYKSDAKRLIDIIEKQQKEIEELKAISEYREKIIKGLGLKTLPKTITGFRELIENNDKKWEDKIKAKIEEVEKELNKLLQKEEWLEPHDTTKRNKYMHYIEFGQSLLEKE